MTSGKGVDDVINTLISKKVNKKSFLTMAKISSWHFRHLLYVVWLKKACKRGGHGHPLPTPLSQPQLPSLYCMGKMNQSQLSSLFYDSGKMSKLQYSLP